MRIERLAQENRRTQGAARRAWYRVHAPQHLRNVATLIEAAIATRSPDAPSRAVALGAGACTELPLEALARRCERVTLVDLDTPGMGEARDELPAGLRERVELLAADLTGGVSAALAEGLRIQPWSELRALAGPAGMAPLDAVASLLDRCPIPDPPALGLPAEGFGLVVSALTLTQLFSLPLLDALDALNLHAPELADLREDYAPYRAAALRFRRRIAAAHLSLMGALLAPGGAGVLLSDVTGYLLPETRGPHAHDGREALPTLPTEALRLPEDVAARFDVIGQPRRWRWLVSEPTADLPGRAYEVVGLVFRRKRR